jgi:PhnB protein
MRRSGLLASPQNTKEEATMAVKAIREGFHTVTPYLMVREAVNLVEFVKQAFGATESFRSTGSAGGLHAEVRIGDSMVMIGGGGTWEPMPAAIYLYMDDVDAVYKQALQAGATSISEPADQPYGDRLAGVKDAFGNVWYISTHKEDVPLN